MARTAVGANVTRTADAFCWRRVALAILVARSWHVCDIDGTKALLAAAEEAGIEHLIHVSIVGLQHMPAFRTPA